MLRPERNQKPRILMVDDDVVELMSFKRHIARVEDHFDYEVAPSVSEAKVAMAKGEFDIIITDYMLSDGIGFELFAVAPNTPFILITGAGNQEVAVRALKGGAYDYLVKDQSSEFYDLLFLSVSNVLKRKQDELDLEAHREHIEQLVQQRTEELNAEIVKSKEANQALKNSEGKWRSLVEQAPDVIFQMDRDGEIVFVNRSFSTHSVLELQGQKYFDFIDHDFDSCNLKEKFHRVLAGETISVDASLTRQPGQTKWNNIRFSPVYQGREVQGAVVVISDISERKNNELELQEAKQAAEAANRAKSNFLTMMSHELRTPMNGVLGMAQLLQISKLTEEQRDWCNVILVSGNRLIDLLSNILNISKIEAGKQNLQLSPFLFRPFVSSVADLFSGSAIAKGLRLNFQIDPKIHGALVGDEELLLRVLSNLVGNAIKFTHDGYIEIVLHLIEESESTQKIQFLVKDTGIGMTEQQKEYVFEPFIQADDKTTRKYGGSGLGLSIAKKILELMGSEIQLECILGVGCEFGFALELGIDKSATPPLEVLALQRKGVIETEGSLIGLVVEDDEVNQQVIQRMLARQKIKVEFAGNGKEALLQAEFTKYDFIFMDILMPTMDGYEATQAIRSSKEGLNQDTPIIAITAMASEEDRKKCFQTGMNDYISKPIDFMQLEEAVQKHCQQ